MNKKYLSQGNFHTQMCDYITNNDLDGVKSLYENHYTKQQKSFFNSFLTICGLGHEILDLYPSCYPLEYACQQGKTDILNFLLQDNNLVEELDKNRKLSDLLSSTLRHGHIDTANVIIPYLKIARKPEEQEFYNS